MACVEVTFVEMAHVEVAFVDRPASPSHNSNRCATGLTLPVLEHYPATVELDWPKRSVQGNAPVVEDCSSSPGSCADPLVWGRTSADTQTSTAPGPCMVVRWSS